MKYRFLGKTGLKVSELCFGTMSFGGIADESTSATMFKVCREAGINFFDCADVYNGGRSEEILGRFISTCRDEVVIASKAYFPTSADPNARGASRYHLVNAVESSLRRLQTDRIDLFYLHRWDDQTDLEDVLLTLEDLRRQGKILYPAVSNFSAWQTMKALGIARQRGWAPIAAAQPMYNLAKRTAEIEILPMAHAEGVAVFPYGPLGGGLLSGKYGVNRRPQQGRLLENDMYKVRYGDERYFALADRFSDLADELGHNAAALAVAWVGAHPAVTAPIIGARTVNQLNQVLQATEVELDSDTRARISALSKAPPPATDRNEEKSEHNYGSR